MENKEMLELLQKIEKNGRQQVRTARLMCILALGAALVCVAALVLIFNYLPRVDAVVTQMQTVLTNLEATTEELASLDFGHMMDGIDGLVSTGQESLSQTMEKLNTLDFATMNKAIKDLAAVVDPLAKLVNRFN